MENGTESILEGFEWGWGLWRGTECREVNCLHAGSRRFYMSVVSCQLSVVSCHWSVVTGHWSLDPAAKVQKNIKRYHGTCRVWNTCIVHELYSVLCTYLTLLSPFAGNGGSGRSALWAVQLSNSPQYKMIVCKVKVIGNWHIWIGMSNRLNSIRPHTHTSPLWTWTRLYVARFVHHVDVSTQSSWSFLSSQGGSLTFTFWIWCYNACSRPIPVVWYTIDCSSKWPVKRNRFSWCLIDKMFLVADALLPLTVSL